MRIEATKKDVIWNYAGTIVNLGSSLVMLPFVLYFLNDAQVGLWYIFQSIASLAIMFDAGFNPTFARNIAYCWSGAQELKQESYNQSGGEVNLRLFRQIIVTSRIIYMIISLVVLVGFSTIGTFYINYVTRDMAGNSIWAWVIWCLALFLNLYYGYFSCLLKGVGDVTDSNKAIIFARVIQLVVLVVTLALGWGLLGVSLAYLLYGLALRIISKKYFNGYKDIGAKLKKENTKVSKAEVKAMFLIIWPNAWKEGGVAFSNYFCNQAGTIVCSLFLRLEETGVYSLAVQLASAVITFSYAIYTSYQPSIQSSVVNGDMDKVRRDFAFTVATYIYMAVLGGIALLFIVRPLIVIIKPASVSSMAFLATVWAYQFILKFRNAYTSYLSNTNRIIYFRAFIVSAVVCVGLEFLMCGAFKWGMWGLILAQIVAQLIFNAWFWMIKVLKEIGISFIKLMKLGTGEIANHAGKILKRKKA